MAVGDRSRPVSPATPPEGAPGSRNQVLAALDAIGEESAADVVRSLVAAARDGDVRSSELLLRRCWPERRGRPVMFDLPPMNTAADLVPAMAKVMDAVVQGLLSPEEGKTVAVILETHRKVIETRDLEARLRRLEAETPGR